jgi:hypothetical protein
MQVNRTNMLAAGCLLALLVVGLRFYFTPERAVRGAAEDRRTLALQILGEHLARQLPGERVLVIGNPFSQQSGQPANVYDFEEAALRGLTEGMGDALKLEGTAFPELDPRAATDPGAVPLPPDLRTPLSLMTTRGAWDRLQEEHPRAGLWVSLIGLPAGISGMKVWRQDGPRFALLLPDLRVLGNSRTVGAAFRSGKLVAAVFNRPGAPPQSARREKDPRDEFDLRYVLVTPDNYEQVLRDHPGLW